MGPIQLRLLPRYLHVWSWQKPSQHNSFAIMFLVIWLSGNIGTNFESLFFSFLFLQYSWEFCMNMYTYTKSYILAVSPQNIFQLLPQPCCVCNWFIVCPAYFSQFHNIPPKLEISLIHWARYNEFSLKSLNMISLLTWPKKIYLCFSKIK